jgi:hypothetical protein
MSSDPVFILAMTVFSENVGEPHYGGWAKGDPKEYLEKEEKTSQM